MNKKKAKKLDKFIVNSQIKARRKQDKEFKALYKLAVKTIRRLRETKEVKQQLINDLLYCNNIEIIHYLGNIKPKNRVQYIERVNSLLEMESIAYEYAAKMVYNVGAKAERKDINGLMCFSGGFLVLTEHIRRHHKYINLKNKIHNISEG